MEGEALPAQDQPRERLLRYGGVALSDAELLGLVLRGGRSLAATEMARSLLDERGGLEGLLRLGEQDLRRPGLGRSRRASILAAIELAKRFTKARMPRDLLDGPAAVASYLFMRFGCPDQEIMGALYLNLRNRLIRETEIYRGTLSRAAVEPRSILKEGLVCSAHGFILFHSHPSGDPSPSSEDLVFTRRLADAGELVGLHLLDHLIVGSAGQWTSLGRRGGW